MFNASNDPDAMTLAPAATAAGAPAERLSSFGTFPTLTFTNKTNVTVNGLGGDDSLAVEFAGANPLPAGTLTFDGGSGPGNRLALRGSSTFTYAVHTATGARSGTLALRPPLALGPVAPTLTYANVDSIDDTLSLTPFQFTPRLVVPPTLVFNATAGPDAMTMATGPVVAGLPTTQLRSAGTFATLNYANKVGVAVYSLLGADTLTVDFAAGNPLPAGGLTYDGGADANRLVLAGDDFGLTTYTPTGPASGTIALGSAFLVGPPYTLTYANVQAVDDTGRPFLGPIGLPPR